MWKFIYGTGDCQACQYVPECVLWDAAGAVYLQVRCKKKKKKQLWGRQRRRCKCNCSRDGITTQHLSHSLESIIAGAFHRGFTIKSHNWIGEWDRLRNRGTAGLVELMTLGLTPTLRLIGAIILILLDVAISLLHLLLFLSHSLSFVSSTLSD